MQDLISRPEAYRQGRTRFFTGKPCKQGHVAERYVSTGNCTACLNPYKLRRHPIRKDLQPYVCPKLWVPVTFTPENYAQLATYLQTCIDTFAAHVNGPPPAAIDSGVPQDESLGSETVTYT